MSKRNVCVFLVLVLSIFLVAVGCSTKNTKQPEQQVDNKQEIITLRLGHELQEDHPYHLGALKFAELLTQKTDGKYEVIVYPNAQLGTQQQLGEMVAADQLDFSLGWQGILEAYDADVGVISLPFLFRDWDHVYKFADGHVGDELFKGVEKKGIKVVTNFNNGLYNIVSRMEVKTPNDMKGLKLRVQPSAVFTRTGEVLGAIVTPMAYSEVYSALQLKAIDAEIQGAVNIKKGKHLEVAKYTCECNINYLLEPLMMSIKTFNAMTADDQKAVMEAGKEAAVWQRENAEKTEQEDTEYLKTNGMQYYEADIEEWEKATASIYNDYPQWKDMVDKIKAIK